MPGLKVSRKWTTGWSQRLLAPLKRPRRPEPSPVAKMPQNQLLQPVPQMSHPRHIHLLDWSPLRSASPAADLGRSASPREPSALGHGLNAAVHFSNRRQSLVAKPRLDSLWLSPNHNDLLAS
jgi:hypothetical protein